MNNLNINVIALALGLAFSAGAMAHSMSKSDYKAGKDVIAVEFKLDKESCISLSGYLNDICLADANGKEKVARANLEYSYKPTRTTRYQAHIAKAEAVYAVAKEQCDDMDNSAKEMCVIEAKAAETAAIADAKAQLNISDASDTASEKPTQARSVANNAFQACAMNMQANIAAFRAGFLQRTN